MSFDETRVALAAALTGLVLATGIGAVATPPPAVATPATQPAQVTQTLPVDVRDD